MKDYSDESFAKGLLDFVIGLVLGAAFCFIIASFFDKVFASSVLSVTGDMACSGNASFNTIDQTEIYIGVNGHSYFGEPGAKYLSMGLGPNNNVNELLQFNGSSYSNNIHYLPDGNSATIQVGGNQPTCSSALKFPFMLVKGGSGVADQLQVCQKDASDNYSWVNH